jgi:hypothetical protein
VEFHDITTPEITKREIQNQWQGESRVWYLIFRRLKGQGAQHWDLQNCEIWYPEKKREKVPMTVGV